MEKADPWTPAREALFNIVRAWVKDDDPQVSAEASFHIMEEVAKTEGASFIFVCEMAQVLATCVAKYMAALNEAIPSREDIMAELDVLEIEYIEEAVLAENDEDDPSAPA